jgi:hypothetical protein
MLRLTGKELPIGLFGRMQGIAARNGCRRLDARPGGKSGFVHGLSDRLRWTGLNGLAENNKGIEAGIFAAETRRSRPSSKEMEVNFGRNSP